MDVAAILDRHFASSAPPADLVLGDLDVPIHPNAHIRAAALRADRDRVRATGRWLARHGIDRSAVTVGLLLLGTDEPTARDVPLIQTLGLLSDHFGAAAADALSRGRAATEQLIWLAQRVAGWGRVYVVRALCGRGGGRDWLLRHACDGEFLNGYFAGQVATAAHLHEAITRPDADDDLVDHTGRLLLSMSDCDGMGLTLDTYPPAPLVLEAYAGHLSRQTPTTDRFLTAAVLAANHAGARRCLDILNRPDWSALRFDPDDQYVSWFAPTAVRLGLRAFQGHDHNPRPEY